jgi:creatinine amidohydrolase
VLASGVLGRRDDAAGILFYQALSTQVRIRSRHANMWVMPQHDTSTVGSKSINPSGKAALPSRWWADLSTRQFADLQVSGQAEQVVAVLPVAAIEQHGPHLPLSVDAILLQGVINAALPLISADLPVLFLPPQNVGLSSEHAAFAGTLSLSPTTVIALWTEIGLAVAQAGIRKLLLLNGHGGQVSVMDIVARELRGRANLLVYSASWFSLPLPDAVAGQFSPHEHRFGIHAGEIETSMMRHLAPDTVHMEHAQNFASTAQHRAENYPLLGNGRIAKLGWHMQDYHPAGAVGNAAAASADKGEAVVQAAAQQLVLLLQELHRLPLNTLGTVKNTKAV